MDFLRGEARAKSNTLRRGGSSLFPVDHWSALITHLMDSI
jgi:hypothetical protein